MVTWTFDLTALFVGFIVGMFIGAFVCLFTLLRDGGSWDVGFNDGCKLKNIAERLERLVETKKEESK